MNWRGIATVLLLSGLAAPAALSAHPRQTSPSRPTAAPSASPSARVARPGLAGSYGKLPLGFEANRGQSDRRVKFLSRGRGYTLFLAPHEAVLALEKSPAQANPGPATPREALKPQKPIVAAVRIELLGGNPDAQLIGLDELPGKSNYFVGNDPANWRTNVPTYARVRIEGAYPGIDLAYYGRQRELEEDFLVAPGADPRAITLGIAGANTISIDDEGELVLKVAGGEVRLRKPVIYQQSARARREIAGGYRLVGKNRVGFELGPYDPAQPLVIDPALAYSTYLGGGGVDEGNGIAVDSSGNAYVTGSTMSSSFPGVTSGSFQSSLQGTEDAFVTKISADGAAVLYSTYLGGGGLDVGKAIAVDSSGNAYVTGFTTSNNFPGANLSGIQSSLISSQDAFVAKISADGTMLLYSTYLGGSGFDQGNGIAVDSSGNASVTGFTGDASFPGASFSAIQSSLNGFEDAFVTKINATGSGLVYSTYLGGSGFFGDGGSAIAVDSSGNAYVTGFTTSIDFPGTSGSPIQPSLNGFLNAFVAEIRADGSGLVYSTYLGGGFDAGNGIAVDSSGNAYVTGFTQSAFFPVAGSSHFQMSLAGAQNAFVAEVSAGGTGLAYSTYLGGNASDAGNAIAVDSSGNAYVTGLTNSTNFPGTSSSTIQSSYGGGSDDAFVTEINPTGSVLVYSTYLGGDSRDIGNGIAVDSAGTAYVAGLTGSSTTPFPTAHALQSALSGSEDAFVAKIVQVVAFSSFSAKLAIFAGPPARFALNSTFTLGSGGSINPLTDPVTLQVGTYSVTIPPGSFSQLLMGSKTGGYVFSGVINGVSLGIQIVPLGGSSYQFKATGQPVNLTGLSNPVSVTITIGNNTGTTAATATFQ